jgi:Mg-chelatase subunit ChlD
LPIDPWLSNSEDWDADYPSGYNWGLEAVDAMGAWGYSEYMQKVNIGIIDSIPDAEHEDLTFEKLAFADSDGTIYEFGDGDYKAADHGSHVAGTIGAEWDEDGVSGIMMDKCSLYYCGVASADSADYYTTPYTYFAAIRYLVDNDVRAINISRNTNRLLDFAASKGNEKAKDILEQQANVLEGLLERYIAKREQQGKPDFVICVSAGNTNGNRFCADKGSPYGYRSADKLKGVKTVSGGALAKYNNYISLIDSAKVAERVIVVGSAGMSTNRDGTVTYSYSYFSCVGDRVDVVAPGEDVLSCIVGEYDLMSGTSMAAPHVTGAAGLIFASNPDLTGAEVKAIIKSTTTSKFIYDGGTSGLLNIRNCVEAALGTKTDEINKIIKQNKGLDICFVIDTTGSMGDDIGNAKENMNKIINSLSKKTDDYRVAIVDYRDFPERSSMSYDYPAKVQLNFTNDENKIIKAINDLNLGHGGDDPETVYSGIMTALSLDWRVNAEKIIIVLGDAPPLDPEPVTGYTYEQVLCALYNADVGVGEDEYKDWTDKEEDDYLINVFTIETGYGGVDFFEDIADSTGGVHTQVDSADQVSGAIINSINKIDVVKTVTVKTPFGEKYSGEQVDIYLDDKYYFSYTLDWDGSCIIEGLEPDKYSWKIERLGVEGELFVKSESSIATPEFQKAPWYAFALEIWYRQRTELIVGSIASLVTLIILIVFVIKFKKYSKKRKEEKAEQARIEQEKYNQLVEAQRMAQAAQQKETETPKDVFCPQCGEKNKSTVKFCAKCGTPFSKDE